MNTSIPLDKIPQEIFDELLDTYDVVDTSNYGNTDNSSIFRASYQQKIYEDEPQYMCYAVRGVIHGPSFELNGVIETGVILKDF